MHQERDQSLTTAQGEDEIQTAGRLDQRPEWNSLAGFGAVDNLEVGFFAEGGRGGVETCERTRLAGVGHVGDVLHKGLVEALEEVLEL